MASLCNVLPVPVSAVPPSRGRGHWGAESLVLLRAVLWVWGLFVLAFFFIILSFQEALNVLVFLAPFAT